MSREAHAPDVDDLKLNAQHYLATEASVLSYDAVAVFGNLEEELTTKLNFTRQVISF